MIRIAIVVCCAALAAAEAEANPQLFYSSFGHQQSHFNPYGPPTVSSYSSYPGYSTYHHNAVRGFASPITVGAYQPYGYAASGRYLADSVGAVHIAKREAEAEPEAEADPAVVYNSFGHHQALYNPAYTTYTTGYPGYSFGSVYSGYRN